MDGSELSRKVDRHEWRLDALDRWRERTERHVSALEERIDTMDKAAEIARAVAQVEARKVANARTSRFSRGELAGGSIVAACAIGSLILQAIQGLHG